MGSYAVRMGNHLYQKALFLQILHHGFSGLIPVHAGIFAAQFINGGVIIHNVDFFQVMAFSYLKVIRVMSRGDLYTAGSKLLIYIFIRDHRDLSVGKRQLQHLSYQMFISFVLRINCHCRISQKGLRTGSSDLHILSFLAYDGIINVPEKSVLVLMFYLCVGNGSLAYRTPVDDPGSFIDIAFLIKTDKDFLYCFGTALVHGKTFSVPVSRSTQLLQLIDDLSTIFFFPGPGIFQEFFPADLIFIDSLFF